MKQSSPKTDLQRTPMVKGGEREKNQPKREDTVKEKGRQIGTVMCDGCKGGENFRKKTFTALTAAAKLEDEN